MMINNKIIIFIMIMFWQPPDNDVYDSEKMLIMITLIGK